MGSIRGLEGEILIEVEIVAYYGILNNPWVFIVLYGGALATLCLFSPILGIESVNRGFGKEKGFLGAFLTLPALYRYWGRNEQMRVCLALPT